MNTNYVRLPLPLRIPQQFLWHSTESLGGPVGTHAAIGSKL